MKKTTTKLKLTLESETLRSLKTLQQQELKHVAGGLTGFISMCCAK